MNIQNSEKTLGQTSLKSTLSLLSENCVYPMSYQQHNIGCTDDQLSKMWKTEVNEDTIILILFHILQTYFEAQ